MSLKEQQRSSDNRKQKSSKPTTKNSDVATQPQIPPGTLIQRARLDPSSLTPRELLQLQRTIGNNAVDKLLSGMKPSPKPLAQPQASGSEFPAITQKLAHRAQQNGGVVQRLTPMAAHQVAIVDNKVDHNWYYELFVPALTTIATKAGSSFNDYIAPLSKEDFMLRVNALLTEFGQEPTPNKLLKGLKGLFSKQPTGPVFIDSKAYPGMKRVQNTNILVEPGEVPGGKPKPALLQFIQNYNAGTLVWYRGINISHFSWGALKAAGVLASEGTADAPTFTMGNQNPSRWLPGVYDRDLTRGLALTIPQGDGGLRALAAQKEIPTGAILKFTITTNTPIAYLNDGEQVIRGPIAAGNITVDTVFALGPDGIRQAAQDLQPTDLPPAAPYGAAANSTAINTWEPLAQNWLNKH
jgi:hypothetical protein